MSNKALGTAFEKRVCDLLKTYGWWVHFLEPNHGGAQPFDIIAVKRGKAIAIDCKTCADSIFRISRLEDNQINAFELWLARGNNTPYVIIEHDGAIYSIPYLTLKRMSAVKLDDAFLWRLHK